MKKLYTLFTSIFILSGINSQGQTACFTVTPFPANALPCEGVTYIFDGSCSVGATSWLWDFGPNAIPSSSNLQFPGLVQFVTCGIANPVTLTINGGGSAAFIATQNIPIYCNPIACFTVTPPTGCAGTNFCFNSSCSQFGAGSNSLSYQWDLCNGMGSTQANPCNTYPDSGCCPISLIVTNNHGCTDFIQQQNAVCISAPPTFQITTNQQAFTVDFCAPPISGGNQPYSYLWIFQGGTPATSTLPCPAGIAFPIGSWQATCTVTDASGCSSTEYLPNLIVFGNGTSILLSDSVICVGECVTVETSVDSSYSWTVNPSGCVTPITTQTTPSTTYCFSCAGDYIITLNSVVNGFPVTDSVTVHVFDKPVASFIVNDTYSNCPPLLDSFINNSTNVFPGTTYQYSFGNGAFSTLENPIHLFTYADSFYVRLIVTNPSGCSDTATSLIVIGGPQVFSHSANPESGNPPLDVSFNISSNSVSYIWDFDDGSFLVNGDSSENHIYTTCGVFYPAVIISDSSLMCTYWFIVDTVTLNCSNLNLGNDTTVCSGNCLALNADVSGGSVPVSINWAPSNSLSCLNCFNPEACVTSTTTFIATTIDSFGVSTTDSITVFVYPSILISESHIDIVCGNNNGSIDITVTGGAVPFNYNWNNSATTQDLNNLSSGNYSVTVTDANNCVASMSITIVNHPSPIITINHIDASCLNCHDGSATVLINGGTPPYTIQWNTGSTNNPIINIDPGVYQVCVTDANGCSVCDSVTVGYAIGINSIAEKEFVQIIPNPNNGIFTLYFSSSVKPEQIEVYNLLGKKIYSLPNIEWKQSTQLNLSFLSDGIYFLKIESAQNLIMKKIVISRK